MKRITLLGVLLLFCSFAINAQSELSSVEQEQLKAANRNIQPYTVDINALLERINLNGTNQDNTNSSSISTGFDTQSLTAAERLALRTYFYQTSSNPDAGCGIASDCNLMDSTPDDATSPNIWDRPIGAGPAISGLGPVSYDVYGPFSVDTAGNYTFDSVQMYDGYLFLYENCFDPLDQLTGLLAGDDDGPGGIGTSQILDFPLVTGTDYYLITSGFAAGDFGDFTNTITGPGTVTCPSGGGGGGAACSQASNPGAPTGGSGSSIDSAFDSAVDVIVPMDENFTLETITANFLTFPADGAPVVADVYYYTNAGGFPDQQIGSETGISVNVLNTGPWINPAIDVHEVEFDVTPFQFSGQFGAETTYWVEILMGTANQTGLVFFEVTTEPATPLVGEPLVQFDGTVWGYPDFGSGPDATREGVYMFEGQCEPIPDNDECSGAFAIACGETLSGDTSDGNTDTNGDGAPDEWFAFTSTAGTTEVVTVSTCNQAGYDTILTVYDSCGGMIIAQNDDGPGCSGFTSELSFAADGSSTYYIAVDGFGGASGTFDLSITCALPPANDDCDGAIAIECGVPIFGTTINATDDSAVAPDCDTPTTTEGVWYVYEDNTGLVTDILVSTCSANTDYDTKISVYTGDCANPPLTCVAGNDDSPNCTNFQSEVEFQSDGNTTYYIFVHGFGGQTGNFELNMTCTPVPPPNDMIVNSIDVDEIGVPYVDPAVAMPAATVENGNPVGCDISGGKGVWYNFTSAGNGTATAEIVSPAGNSFVVFFTAPDENAIETDLEYFFQIGNQCAPGTVANINTAAGTVYYVYVVNDGGITDITIDGTLLSTNDNVIEGFSFYPNPTTGSLNLDSINTIEDVAIYNLLGQQVLGQSIDATSAQLDTSALSTGAYLMKVTVDGQTGTYKVIKR